MSMEHTQVKRFIGKEIYQKSSCVSDIPSETYPPLLNSPPPVPPCRDIIEHFTYMTMMRKVNK